MNSKWIEGAYELFQPKPAGPPRDRARGPCIGSVMMYFGIRFFYRFTKNILVGLVRFLFQKLQNWGPPIGAYSGLDLLRAGRVQGQVLFESQALPRFLPGSVTLICGLKQESGQPWPLFWCHLKKTRLVGPSLCPCDGEKRIMEESAYGKNFYGSDPSYNYLHLSAPQTLKGPWTSMACRWDRGYYHWFMDVLPRLASLSFFPLDTRCLARGPLQPFQDETLRWLGLQDRFIFTEENHFFAENFFYAGLAGMSGCINPWKVAFLRDHLGKMSAGQLGQGENVYIIRRGKTRGLRNEQEVEAFFRRRGWSVIDTEQLTVAQQAGIFAQAKKICTLHGAALTNLIWASPGTQVLELLADNFLNGVYEGLAKVLGLDYSFRIYRGDSRCRIHVLEEDLMAWLEKPA